MSDSSSQPPPLAKVMVIIPSDITVRMLVASGALKTLAQNTEIHFFVSPTVTSTLPGSTVILQLKSVGTPLAERLDRLFWYHALYEYMRKHKIQANTNFKVSNLRWVMRRLHQLLAISPISRWVRKLDNWYFSYDKGILAELKRIHPDLVIAPGMAMDTYSHMVLRTAHKLNIRTLMIVSHWDYFTKKGFLRVKPDRVYVWGEDMRNAAVTSNGVTASDIAIVGAPQFQKYLTGLPEKAEARAKLGIKTSSYWLLFLGAGLPYDELSVLKELSEALRHRNRSDVGILYRPHPRAWPRSLRERIEPEQLSNVIVDDPHFNSHQTDTHYQTLLAAADGTISPYSTMILEGGLCGIPALCIGFADGVNTWDYSQVNTFDHIRPLLDRHWVTPCFNWEDLTNSLDIFLGQIAQEGLDRVVRAEVRNTVYFDDRSYADRLWDSIKKDFHI